MLPLWSLPPWEGSFSSPGLGLGICKNTHRGHPEITSSGLTEIQATAHKRLRTQHPCRARLGFLPQMDPQGLNKALAHSRCSINSCGKRPTMRRSRGLQRKAGMGVKLWPPSRNPLSTVLAPIQAFSVSGPASSSSLTPELRRNAAAGFALNPGINGHTLPYVQLFRRCP